MSLPRMAAALCVGVFCLSSHPPALAAGSEELEQVKSQLAELRQSYEARLQALEKRIAELQQATATAPTNAATAAAASPPAPAAAHAGPPPMVDVTPPVAAATPAARQAGTGPVRGRKAQFGGDSGIVGRRDLEQDPGRNPWPTNGSSCPICPSPQRCRRWGRRWPPAIAPSWSRRRAPARRRWCRSSCSMRRGEATAASSCWNRGGWRRAPRRVGWRACLARSRARPSATPCAWRRRFLRARGSSSPPRAFSRA